MNAQEVLNSLETLSSEELATIYNRIAEMMVDDLSPEEIEEIRVALEESDAEIERGEVLTSEQLRKQLGLT